MNKIVQSITHTHVCGIQYIAMISMLSLFASGKWWNRMANTHNLTIFVLYFCVEWTVCAERIVVIRVLKPWWSREEYINTMKLPLSLLLVTPPPLNSIHHCQYVRFINRNVIIRNLVCHTQLPIWGRLKTKTTTISTANSSREKKKSPQIVEI